MVALRRVLTAFEAVQDRVGQERLDLQHHDLLPQPPLVVAIEHVRQRVGGGELRQGPGVQVLPCLRRDIGVGTVEVDAPGTRLFVLVQKARRLGDGAARTHHVVENEHLAVLQAVRIGRQCHLHAALTVALLLEDDHLRIPQAGKPLHAAHEILRALVRRHEPHVLPEPLRPGDLQDVVRNEVRDIQVEERGPLAVRTEHLVVDFLQHTGLVVVHRDHLIDARAAQHLGIEVRRRRLPVELLVGIRPRHLGMVAGMRPAILGGEEQVRFDQDDAFRPVLLGGGRDEQVAHGQFRARVLRGRGGDQVDTLAAQVTADVLEIARVADEAGTELGVREGLQRDDVGDLRFLSYVVGGVEREGGIRPVGHDHEIVPVIESAVHLPPSRYPAAAAGPASGVPFRAGNRATGIITPRLRGGRPSRGPDARSAALA